MVLYLARPYFEKNAAPATMALYGLNPAMIYWSCSAEGNMPFPFFGMAALTAFDHFARKQEMLFSVLTGLFSELSFVYKELIGFFMLG